MFPSVCCIDPTHRYEIGENEARDTGKLWPSRLVEGSELGHSLVAAFEPTTQWVLLFCLVMPEDVKCTGVFYMWSLQSQWTKIQVELHFRVITDPGNINFTFKYPRGSFAFLASYP